jgi:2',3'-cyclic-nucleotide 2'-phosphodiesterase
MQNNLLRILFLGDIVGKPGRKAAMQLVQEKRRSFDCILANCENASGGKGINSSNAQELLDAGIDAMSSGNHIWHQKEVIPYLDATRSIIRPLNYPPGTPGSGFLFLSLKDNSKIALVNILGRVFMEALDCPFRAMENILPYIQKQTSIILVDFHAEASSEKRAMGFYLDGKVSAMVGTHTHVPTHDYQILPKGTAYITDIGMTGPHHSVIGVDHETIIQRYLSAMPDRFEVSKETIQRVDYVEIDIDKTTGQALRIEGKSELFDA